MTKYIKILFILASCLSASCTRVKDEATNLKNKATETLSRTKDKFFPAYDSQTPDTENNRKRFEEFFGFKPTKDVKSIYCYADEMGIDSDYSFAFKCDNETIRKIEDELDLGNDSLPKLNPSALFHDFEWWNKDKIDSLQPSWRKGDHEKYYLLWYDSLNREAYYFEYNL